jgi:hypothetical protein
MGAGRRARSIGVAAVLACGVVAATASSATAVRPIDRSHERIVFTDPDDEICGIPVTTTVDIVDNFTVRLDRNGFLLFHSRGTGTVTSTNPENGQSIVLRFTGASRDLSVTDNGDGTITVRTAVTGMPEAIASDGRVLTRDSGRVVFATVLDFNDTPTDVDDDVFISQSVESVSGPHPELDSDFELFCEVVVPALT